MAFILASASPRRLDLLNQIDRAPDRVEPSDVDETPLAGELPNQLASRLAQSKTENVALRFPDDVVLGADTVVACGRRVLGKPADEKEARAFLKLLSGRRHRVYGGLCVMAPHGQWQRLIMTQVVFRRLSEDDIQAYIASDEWHGKAGAYGIQGRAATFVKRINGSYSNVVGLCLNAAENILTQSLGPVRREGG